MVKRHKYTSDVEFVTFMPMMVFFILTAIMVEAVQVVQFSFGRTTNQSLLVSMLLSIDQVIRVTSPKITLLDKEM